MLIPIGHDETGVRRWPWVTFSIMALCLLMFLATLPGVGSAHRRINAAFEELGSYYLGNTDLDIDPELEKRLLSGIRNDQGQRDAFKAALQAYGISAAEPTDGIIRITREQRQAHLDELSRAFLAAMENTPYHRWGFVPAEPSLHGVVTHMFMHSGWSHLIFNMLFLYLAGPYVEDRWGRALYGGFYVVGGVVALAAFALLYLNSDQSMIGASGAIAAVMGAFLVKFWSTKIRFLFFFFFIPRVIDLPAWLMLPLWLLREIFYGQAAAMGADTGTAHLAHIGGFVFGVGAAVAFGRLKIEERWVEVGLEKKAVQFENPRLDLALKARAVGELDRAAAMLREIIAEHPGDPGAAAALWDLERDRGSREAALKPVLAAIQTGMRNGDTTLLETHWEEVLHELPDGMLDPVMGARVAEVIRVFAPESVVRRTVDLAATAVDSTTPSGIVQRLARVAAELGAPSTAALAQRALASGDLPLDIQHQLQEIADTAPHPEAVVAPPPRVRSEPIPDEPFVEPGAPGAPHVIREPVPLPGKKTLDLIEAVPTAWSNGVLSLDADGNQLQISAMQVQAVSVAGIDGNGGKAYIVVDLLMDPPWGERERLRGVRLRGDTFDPRTLVPGKDAMAAFRAFLDGVLLISEAAELPDPDGAHGNPFRRFASIEEYQTTVLNVVP